MISPESKKTIFTWGVKFDLLSMNDFISSITQRIIEDKTPIHITGVNPETVVIASRDEFMRNAILNSDLVNIDNAFIVLTLRLCGYKVPSRIATPDLFEELLLLSAKNCYRVFILGAKENVLEQAIKNIINDYPDIIIDGLHGYYNRENEIEVIDRIKDFKTDMLFVALPSPAKELFILKYKATLKVKLLLGVGGAVDCRSGFVERAPEKFRRIGLEGIFRAMTDPMYYGKRYFTFYPSFLKIVFKQMFSLR